MYILAAICALNVMVVGMSLVLSLPDQWNHVWNAKVESLENLATKIVEENDTENTQELLRIVQLRIDEPTFETILQRAGDIRYLKFSWGLPLLIFFGLTLFAIIIGFLVNIPYLFLQMKRNNLGITQIQEYNDLKEKEEREEEWAAEWRKSYRGEKEKLDDDMEKMKNDWEEKAEESFQSYLNEKREEFNKKYC